MELTLNSGASEGGWRRGWDSHHCRVLQTKNLRDLRFLTIRQIRTKALVETRIEHAEHALQDGVHRRLVRASICLGFVCPHIRRDNRSRSVNPAALVSGQWVDQICASSNRLIGWLRQLDTLRGAALAHFLFLTQGNDRIDE